MVVEKKKKMLLLLLPLPLLLLLPMEMTTMMEKASLLVTVHVKRITLLILFLFYGFIMGVLI